MIRNRSVLFQIFAASLALVCSASAFAGKEVGNGGDIVVCYSDADHSRITSIDLFDYWEMPRVYSYLGLGPIDLGASTLSVSQKVQIFLDRLEKKDSELGTIIRQIAEPLVQNVNSFLTDETIPEVNDEHSKLSPQAPCVKAQFAVQIKEPGPGKRRFAISRAWYDHPLTSNDVRAGLLIHEALYRYAISEYGAHNSEGARTINTIVASAGFSALTSARYAELRALSGFLAEGCRAVGMPGGTAVIYVDNGDLCLPFDIEVGSTRIVGSVGSSVQILGGDSQRHDRAAILSLAAGSYAEIKVDGEVKKIRLVPETKDQLRLSFDRKGTLLLVDASPHSAVSDPIELEVQGGRVACSLVGAPEADVSWNYDNSRFVFSDEGKLIGCTIAGPTEILINGQKVALRADRRVFSRLELTPGGAIHRFEVPSFTTAPDPELLTPGGRTVRASGRIVLGPKERILQAESIEPLTVEFHGQKMVFTSLDFNENAETASPKTSFSFVSPTLDGKRLIGSVGAGSQGFCDRQFPDVSLSYLFTTSISRTSSEYVNGSRKYVDVASGDRVVTKTDQLVKDVIDEMSCENVFLLRL